MAENSREKVAQIQHLTDLAGTHALNVFLTQAA